MFQIVNCGIEHLIPPGSNSCECREHFNIRLQANPLELPPVSMRNALPAKVDDDISRLYEVSHIAIRSLRSAPDESRAIGRFKKQPCMLRLAQGALVYQHHGC